MAEHVEGDFKHFVFKMLKPEDYPKALAHLRKVFYKEEPSCKISELGDEEYELIDKYVLFHLNLNDDLSFYVEEKATGKVAGVRITYRKSKDTPELDLPNPSQKMLGITSMLEAANKKVDLYDIYGIDFYADFLMTSVDPEFQRQGLVTEIYKRSIALLRAKGYPVCKSVFSSPFTRKAATNLGFQEHSRLYFLDHKNEQGELILPSAEPDMCAAVMALKLS